jgi:short-subunit dehydrogenase
MTSTLEGHTALITGASRGIGRAIALAFAERGCRLALSARSEQALSAVAAECQERGAPGISLHAADLSRPNDIDRLAQEVQKAGDVDILVNNAGIGSPGNATSGDPDDWERMLAINLHAPMRLTRHLAPAMALRERGAIINIGSVAAVEGMTNNGAYAAAKHGLRGWSLSCYQHLRRSGIKVTIINPGLVATDMTRTSAGAREDRMIRPDDVAGAALLAVTTSPMCCPEEITLRLTRHAYE